MQVRTVRIILAGCLLAAVTGCENAERSPLIEQIDTLRLEKTELTRQIEQTQSENKQLRKQIEVLSGLPQDKFESLCKVQRIKLTKYTNLYDKDEDGRKDKLIVYIQPVDEDGDTIKAAGAVDVQLWDLNKKDDKALLGEWHIKPRELKKLWLSALLATNYRLTFDVTDKIDSFEEPLTVKITFTDYLTGKVFKEQKVIKP